MEAWHLVRNHPEFGKLDRSKIEGLKKELSMAVRCCGYVRIPSFQSLEFPVDEGHRFSAVLDEDVFWSALDRTLASGAID